MTNTNPHSSHPAHTAVVLCVLALATALFLAFRPSVWPASAAGPTIQESQSLTRLCGDCPI